MKYENWISYRYLIASKGRFLTFLNLISIIGVAIGVTSLIVVTGIMTGFSNNLKEKIIGATPHIMIEKEVGITDYQKVKEKVLGIEGVAGASAYVQGSLFIDNEGEALGIVLRGIEPAGESSATKVQEYLKEGKITDLAEDKIFIGTQLARYFDYRVGDTLTLISPRSGLKGGGWNYDLQIAGIFETGMSDFDMSLVLVNIAKAQEIFNMSSDVVSGIGVRLVDPYMASDIKMDLYEALGYEYLLKSWIDINRNLFEALFLEKWGLFIVLTMMVLIASFNIISTLVVTITSKIHDIGILQSIGVSRKSIRKIFTKQGIYIGMLGTFWGLVGGCGLAYILRTYIEVPQEIYSIDHVPIELQLTDIVIIVICTMIISYLASIYPAFKASRLQPVEALRYE